MQINKPEIYEKLHTGELYDSGDPALLEYQRRCMEPMYAYNAAGPSESGLRMQLLHEMLAEAGEGCWIEPPFHANWGGAHLHLGRDVYANFNLTAVDDTHIYIGDGTLIGPNVTIITALHPMDPALRRQTPGIQYNRPVHIGRNCWIAAGVLIHPGVTIGDNAIIGSGSIVTRDIPANVLAMGAPCRVVRPIPDGTDRSAVLQETVLRM